MTAALLVQPPGYWRYETTGRLRPAVETLLAGGALTGAEIVLVREYLARWIEAPAWHGAEVEILRKSVQTIRTMPELHRWLDHALMAGITPL